MAEQRTVVKTTLIPIQEEKDNYAIEFTEWLCDYEITKEQIKTRLEIFKKEKGYVDKNN